MGMKIAVSGKGGVGKTTVAGAIARYWAMKGKRVLAVDADPVNHLADVLGIPEDRRPEPLSSMSELIEERTGVAPGMSFGKLFRMNPKVDDIPSRYSVESPSGARLLVLGTIDLAGSGCFCPESALLRTLIDHLVLMSDDYLVVDMEAGLEHLGRGSSRGIDLLLIVVEPGHRSIDTAVKIRALADGIGIQRVKVIMNKVDSGRAAEQVSGMLSESGLETIGCVPRDPLLEEADLKGISPFSIAEHSPAIDALSKIADDVLIID